MPPIAAQFWLCTETGMRSFRSVETLRVALSAALGLASSSCGGKAIASSSDADGGSRTIPSDADGGTRTTSSDADGGTHTTAQPTFRCVNPAPITIGGQDTGYDTCQGGTVRRRAIVDCPNLLPRASNGACPYAPDSGIVNDCEGDSDCTMHPLGLCKPRPQTPGCYCEYSNCVRDSDCFAGAICVCADPVGQCTNAACNAGTCRAGFECASEGCYGATTFACQTANDACFSNSDCPQASGCFVDIDSGARACSVCGTP
jgi:hypothetical protein